MQLKETLASWVGIPSVSGDEGAFADRVASDCEARGLTVRLQEVGAERRNVLASVGRPRILFCTHLDTVPPHLPFVERDGAWYGRGTCDAKGVLLAQLEALCALRERGREDVGLLAVVGEETTHDGAGVAAGLPEVDGAWVILGEPTGNVIVSAQKGLLKLVLKSEGVAAHSGYPERGRSALEPLLDLLAALRARTWPASEGFGQTTCNIGLLSAGVAANVIPPAARAEILFRASVPTAALEEPVRALAGPLGVAVEVTSRAEPQEFFVPEGWPSKPVAFNTDAAYLGAGPSRISLLGPGYIEHAHSPEERITEAGLRAGIELYVRLVEEHA